MCTNNLFNNRFIRIIVQLSFALLLLPQKDRESAIHQGVLNRLIKTISNTDK
jgi:hypothetical protein